MSDNKKNWVEHYPYLQNLCEFSDDLVSMPRTKEDLEQYCYKIDNRIPTTELIAFLKRIKEYQGSDLVFIDKINDILTEERSGLKKKCLNKLWKDIEKETERKRKSEVISKQKEERLKEKQFPENYIKEVEDFLLSENKFDFIEKILDYRVVRETKNKVLVFLLLSGAYTDNHQIVFEIGESTGGKSHIAENVVDLFPKEHTWTLTGASDKALIYKKWDKEKIIHIPEVQRNPAIQENLKDFGDQGIFYYTVEKNEENKFETREIIIGRKSIVLTSTIEGLNPQLENRAWKLEPDHSIKQSKEIVDHSIEQREDSIKTLESEAQQKYEEKILKLSILMKEKEYSYDKTEIPYLREISDILNYSFLKIRRDHKKFFELITIITNWNYKIREYFELNNFRILLSHPNDLINAFDIGEEIFMNLTQNLTPEKRKILNCFEIMAVDQKKEQPKDQQLTLTEEPDKKKSKKFNTNRIYDFFSSQENYRKSKKTFRNLLNSLAGDGYLEKEKKGRDNVYKLREGNALKLLDENRRKEIYINCFELYNHRKEILKSFDNIKFFENKIDLIKLDNLNLYSNDLYRSILKIFIENKTNKLNIDNIIQALSLDYSKDFIEKEIYTMIKLGLFTKNFDNELIYNEKKDGDGRENEESDI